MRRTRQPPDSQTADPNPTIWQQLKLPVSLGVLLGSGACVLTRIIFGTTPEAFFLMAAIGGSCLVIPSLIVIISHLTSRTNG